MKSVILAFALVFACSFSLAGDRERLTELEGTITKKLKSDKKKEFYQMFYFSSGKKHQDDIHQEIRALFERHFNSGIGEVVILPLKDQDYHKEVMGYMEADGLHRAPGPPFAYLVVYPADKNDPKYMGLNFRLAKIAGKTRIVFYQHEPDVSQFLNGQLSTWKRANQSQFDARLVRVINGQAHFRTKAAEPLVIAVAELSTEDQERINALTTQANKTLHTKH